MVYEYVNTYSLSKNLELRAGQGGRSQWRLGHTWGMIKIVIAGLFRDFA
jgi:hypothetical protein